MEGNHTFDQVLLDMWGNPKRDQVLPDIWRGTRLLFRCDQRYGQEPYTLACGTRHMEGNSTRDQV